MILAVVPVGLNLSGSLDTLQALSSVVRSVLRGFAGKYSTTERENCVFEYLRCIDRPAIIVGFCIIVLTI